MLIVPDEAATVQMITERYLEVANIRTLVEDLKRDGIVSKQRVMKDGQVRGGVPFRRGALAWLLSNRTYVGEVVHKDAVYPGEHDAIVPRDLFEAVQAKLADRTSPPIGPGGRKRIALLAGMIRDDRTRPMSPVHTRNHDRRYSYYASNMNDDAATPALRLPAGELEDSVRDQIAGWLRNADHLRKLVPDSRAVDLSALSSTASRLSQDIADGSVAQARQALEQISLAVSVSPSHIEARMQPDALFSLSKLTAPDLDAICITIPASTTHYGSEPRLRLEPTGSHPTPRDERLVELLARAFAARAQLLERNAKASAALLSTQLRHLQQVAKFSYLDPIIIRAVLNGNQPRTMNARSLWRSAELPLDWTGQRLALGFPAA